MLSGGQVRAPLYACASPRRRARPPRHARPPTRRAPSHETYAPPLPGVHAPLSRHARPFHQACAPPPNVRAIPTRCARPPMRRTPLLRHARPSPDIRAPPSVRALPTRRTRLLHQACTPPPPGVRAPLGVRPLPCGVRVCLPGVRAPLCVRAPLICAHPLFMCACPGLF
jgi:hypothetical protein